MDLVDFDRGVFDDICDNFADMLHGAMAASDSDERQAWRQRHHAESRFARPGSRRAAARIPRDRRRGSQSDGPNPFAFPVQLVSRPNHAFRGYAGQIVSGTVHPGDEVTIWPSGRTTRVKRIVTWDGDLEVARSPMSVTLTLEDELDVSRGDVIAVGDVGVSQIFRADVVWMDERPLDPTRVYVLKHTCRTVTAGKVDHPLVLNQIGSVDRATARPLIADRYAETVARAASF